MGNLANKGLHRPMYDWEDTMNNKGQLIYLAYLMGTLGALRRLLLADFAW
jgi:hypothetical protein